MTTSDVPAIGWHDAVAQAVSTHPWLAHLTAIDGTGAVSYTHLTLPTKA